MAGTQLSKSVHNQPGHYNSAPETREDGEESGFEFTPKGNLKVASTDESGNSPAVDVAGADAVSNTKNTQATNARILGFNGTTWDRIRTAITTATSTLTGILNVLGLGKYNATPPTLTDGQVVVDQVDVNGNKKVTFATGLNKIDDGVTVYAKGVNASVISKTTTVTIGGGVANDTKLVGLMITNALTGTCVIGGLADSDGTAQSITLPVGSVGEKNFYRAKNLVGALTVTCSNAADDNLVVVLWEVNTDTE